MNKKLYWLIFVLVISGLLLSACAKPQKPPADLLESIIQRGTIIIATDPAYPPYSQLVEGVTRPKDTKCASDQRVAAEFSGFDIDTAVEVAKRLGVEPCFVTPDWTLIIGGNWADRWDVSIGSMSMTTERMGNLYFTQPYYTGIEAFYVHKDNTTIKQISDLSGKKIGACAGATYEYYLDKTLTVPGFEIDFLVDDAQFVGYETDLPAVQDLALGDGLRLDAVMTGYNIGEQAIKDGLPIKMVEPTVIYAFNAGAVDKASTLNSVSLAKKISEIFVEMHKDGTLLKFSNQSFGYDCVSKAAEYDIAALKQW
jgi:polar amino acid transport system substrate-binding protein